MWRAGYMMSGWALWVWKIKHIRRCSFAILIFSLFFGLLGNPLPCFSSKICFPHVGLEVQIPSELVAEDFSPTIIGLCFIVLDVWCFRGFLFCFVFCLLVARFSLVIFCFGFFGDSVLFLFRKKKYFPYLFYLFFCNI